MSQSLSIPGVIVGVTAAVVCIGVVSLVAAFFLYPRSRLKGVQNVRLTREMADQFHALCEEVLYGIGEAIKRGFLDIKCLNSCCVTLVNKDFTVSGFGNLHCDRHGIDNLLSHMTGGERFRVEIQGHRSKEIGVVPATLKKIGSKKLSEKVFFAIMGLMNMEMYNVPYECKKELYRCFKESVDSALSLYPEEVPTQSPGGFGHIRALSDYDARLVDGFINNLKAKINELLGELVQDIEGHSR